MILSIAGVISDGLNSATDTAVITLTTSANMGLYFPTAKIGNGNYVYAWSGGYNLGWNGNETGNDGKNYFGISKASTLNVSGGGQMTSSPGLSVQQAYNIDKKIDDGLPQSGNILAIYVNGISPPWAGSGNITGASYTTATTASSTSCFDNGGGSGAMQYSTGYSGGNNLNCALSFKFQ